MRLPKWFERFRKRPAPPKSKLACECCGRLIHRYDKFRILKVAHVDCGDRKLVGQMSMPGNVVDRGLNKRLNWLRTVPGMRNPFVGKDRK